MARFSDGRLLGVTSYPSRDEALAAGCEPRAEGELTVATPIRTPRSSQRIWALYAGRARRRRSSSTSTPTSSGSRRCVAPASYHGHDGVRAWARASRRAWKSVTVVLDGAAGGRRLPRRLRADLRPRPQRRPGGRHRRRVRRRVPRRARRARRLVPLRGRRAGLGQRASRAALASAIASSRGRDLAGEARLGDLRQQLARAPGRGAMPSSRGQLVAAHQRRLRAPPRATRAPRPARRARARGAWRSPRRPCARASRGGRRRDSSVTSTSTGSVLTR